MRYNGLRWGFNAAFIPAISVIYLYLATVQAAEYESNYNPPSNVVLKERDCAALLQHNRTLYHEISYKGHLRNYFGSEEADAQLVAITYQGCVKVCGDHWRHNSQTTLDLLLDWILPALGLIMQMPWETNKGIVLVFCLARWIGSPIASLTFCLWDVKIAAKCAKLVDFSTRYRPKRHQSNVLMVESIEEEEMQAFLESRDKFYILLVMNQFQLIKAAEEFLKPEELVKAVEKAIFSDEVGGMDLVERRREIATLLRDRRQQGIIPMFIGLIGFFFAMAVAISKAFAEGEQEVATAFNVCLGLLIAWLPVLNIAAQVDSDHGNKDLIAEKFNELVSMCHKTGEKIRIFGDGRGQGRGRWHYGIGQTMMSRIEDEYLERHRPHDPINWNTLIEQSPDPDRRIEFGHWRIIEPIISAFFIVTGISSGSFILAYFTPPVGIAWRSAAYLTCVSFAVLLFLIDICLFKVVRHAFLTPSHRAGRSYDFFKSFKFRRTAHIFLICLEILNCLCLLVLVLAMATGLFNFCAGSAVDRSVPGGGIVILNDGHFFQKYFDVASYWILGIVPGMILMCVAVIFLIEQWFTQNFLWEADERKAFRYWKKTRKWKRIYTLGGLLEAGATVRWTM